MKSIAAHGDGAVDGHPARPSRADDRVSYFFAELAPQDSASAVLQHHPDAGAPQE